MSPSSSPSGRRLDRRRTASSRPRYSNSFSAPSTTPTSGSPFAKGSLNGHSGLNLLLDSGLAFTMPLVIVNETVEFLGLPKNPVPNTKFFWSPIESHGLGPMIRGKTQALGNVIVE